MTLGSPQQHRLREEPEHPDWFFTGQVTCPVCETEFEFLRVRDSAIHPSSRDSDFRVRYSSVDPSHYVVTVCPHCSFAAFHDDFDELPAADRVAVDATRAARQAAGAPYVCGERAAEDVAAALDCALDCSQAIEAGDRHEAGLLHRRAWVERDRGDADAERQWLQRARDAYARAYEHDDSLTDAEAVRLSYLVGDLSFRLGDIEQASQWLSTCVAMPQASKQPVVIRLARDRLAEARESVRRGGR